MDWTVPEPMFPQEVPQFRMRKAGTMANRFRKASAEASRDLPATKSEAEKLPRRRATPASRKLKLCSSEGMIVEAEEDASFKSSVIKDLAASTPPNTLIFIPRVSNDILRRVLDYCVHEVRRISARKLGTGGLFSEHPVVTRAQLAGEAHERSSASGDHFGTWHKTYIYTNRDHLLQLLDAAYYLNIKDLLELICKAIGHKIALMNPKEIQMFFSLQRDLSYDDERMIREAFPWAHGWTPPSLPKSNRRDSMGKKESVPQGVHPEKRFAPVCMETKSTPLEEIQKSTPGCEEKESAHSSRKTYTVLDMLRRILGGY